MPRPDAVPEVGPVAWASTATPNGTAAWIWADSGFTVLALAPTARAAAELARATGMPAETAAKWVHEQHRPAQAGPGHPPMARPLDPRTVLIVDEASMYSTDDLDGSPRPRKPPGPRWC